MTLNIFTNSISKNNITFSIDSNTKKNIDFIRKTIYNLPDSIYSNFNVIVGCSNETILPCKYIFDDNKVFIYDFDSAFYKTYFIQHSIIYISEDLLNSKYTDTTSVIKDILTQVNLIH